MADEIDDQVEELTEEIARRWDPERLRLLVRQRAGQGEPLPLHLRQAFERTLQVPLEVTVFTGEFAQEYVEKRGADAITVADTGMVLMGKRATESLATSPLGSPGGAVSFGERVLAHEATHVAQGQKGLLARSDAAVVDVLEQAALAHEESHAAETAGGRGEALQRELVERVRRKLEEYLTRQWERQGLDA